MHTAPITAWAVYLSTWFWANIFPRQNDLISYLRANSVPATSAQNRTWKLHRGDLTSNHLSLALKSTFWAPFSLEFHATWRIRWLPPFVFSLWGRLVNSNRMRALFIILLGYMYIQKYRRKSNSHIDNTPTTRSLRERAGGAASLARQCVRVEFFVRRLYNRLLSRCARLCCGTGPTRIRRRHLHL